MPHRGTEGFIVREGSTYEAADAPGHGAPKARRAVGEVLLEEVHLRSLQAGSFLLQFRAVLVDIVGLDCCRVKTVEGLDEGGHRLGGRVGLGWVYRLDGRG